MTRVDITTAGHTIIIDSDDPLDVVACVALDLHQQTRDNQRISIGFSSGGCHAERAEPYFGVEA